MPTRLRPPSPPEGRGGGGMSSPEGSIPRIFPWQRAAPELAGFAFL